MAALSKYITIEEFERSTTAIRRNIPNKMGLVELNKAKALAVNVLDPIRAYYGRPMRVTSGYRSKQVNALVGGSAKSQHLLGEACDFTIEGVSIEQVFMDIKAGKIKGLEYDQLIHEVGWIHISYREGKNREEALRANFTATHTEYRPA